MGKNVVETIMGAVVLAVAGYFLSFAYSSANIKTVEGYIVKAKFFKSGGLEIGNDIRIGGIKVGSIVKQELDLEDFSAVIHMSIKPEIKLPTDTVATISSEGLLGGKYIKLEPGVSKEKIESNGEIKKTKDYKSLEDMVGELIFLATQGEN
ncbi:MAG: MCE family protein [Alphaproteobacteria bacterium]|nr:MCE family protein [Alphaproteobacteria bacterium]